MVVTSVFAQPDSESEELLKCAVRPFWVLEELTIMTVSFHIRYRYTVTYAWVGLSFFDVNPNRE